MKAIFVKRTQSVLKGVADVAPELANYFPVPEDGSVNGISRVSGYLNLLYHEVCPLYEPNSEIASADSIISSV